MTSLLADYLQKKKVLHTPALREAFQRIDRRDFLPSDLLDEAELDTPFPIGYGQTNSQPTTVAFMLELLEPKQGYNILDIGSGSGWTTALIANVVGKKGRVIGLERIPELVAFGNKNLKKYDLPQAEIQQAHETLGLLEEAPFQRILVSAAAKKFPQSLLDQLTDTGILVIPIQEQIWKIQKQGQKRDAIIEKYDAFLFVPLIYKNEATP